MYYLLSVLTGILISVMLVVNGELAGVYGIYPATVVIHIVGLFCIAIIILAKRETVFPRTKLPWYYYLGGVIGVATTVFNNIAFGQISVSAIMALGLLGQSLASFMIDQFGWFSMQKRPFNRKKLLGFGAITLGIICMIVF